jgi:predicted nucleic acid-binding Zn ribbon protein
MIVKYMCPVCGSLSTQVEDLSDYPHSVCPCGAMRKMLPLDDDAVSLDYGDGLYGIGEHNLD